MGSLAIIIGYMQLLSGNSTLAKRVDAGTSPHITPHITPHTPS